MADNKPAKTKNDKAEPINLNVLIVLMFFIFIGFVLSFFITAVCFINLFPGLPQAPPSFGCTE